MAETGILETTQFELSSLVLIATNGKAIDLKFITHDINIYQDIYSNCLSGEIFVQKDSLNIITAYGLHGNEYLYIKFSNPGSNGFERVFRIYKISEYNVANLNSLEYTIHFCSEEFVLNQQKRISKSYKNLTVSRIIEDILQNHLKLSDDLYGKTVIEETKGAQSLIIPNMRPLEAINWLSSFSINEKLSSAFLFYENQFGYNFRSLETIYSDPIYKKITMQPKNVQTDTDKKQLNNSNVDRFKIKQLFDVIETESTGGYSSKLLRIDIVSQGHKEIRFDPITNASKHLNDYVPFNDAKNRFENDLTAESAYYRYFPMFQGDLTDKWLLQRAMQLSLLNSFRMNVQLPGDSQITAGTILDLDFPFIKPIDSADQAKSDPYLSGKYLVTSVRHRIFNNKYTNYLEICRDSNKTALPFYGKNQAYDIAKKS